MFVKEIDPNELSSLLEADNPPMLIDVRTPGEIAAGALPGHIAMPLNTVPPRMNEIPKDQTVVFYCRTGARSAQACMYMAQHGYENTINLRGGIVYWAQHGLPIVPGQLPG